MPLPRQVLTYGNDQQADLFRPWAITIFYRRSIPLLRKTVADLARDLKYLNYLTAMQVVEFSFFTAIIGHDG